MMGDDESAIGQVIEIIIFALIHYYVYIFTFKYHDTFL